MLAPGHLGQQAGLLAGRHGRGGLQPPELRPALHGLEDLQQLRILHLGLHQLPAVQQGGRVSGCQGPGETRSGHDD